MIPHTSMAAPLRKFGHVCSRHPIKQLIWSQMPKINSRRCTTNGIHTSSKVLCDKEMTESKKNIKSEDSKTVTKSQKISKAMMSYMERAKAHDSMLTEQIEEYEIGKRHLANIMGEDIETFSQDDINKAISYLLPSGLFDKKARPVMKHPYEIFPKRKAAQFGMDGRPYHYLFYTGKPNFYELLHDIAMKFEELRFEETGLLMKETGLKPIDTMAANEDKQLSFHGYQWLPQDVLEKLMIETLSTHDYSRFTILMTRLLEHPLSYKEENFIFKYARKLISMSKDKSVEKPLVDEDGREFMKSYGKRKTSHANVTVWNKGSGQITINGQDLSYFKHIPDRTQLLFPLQVIDKINKVDIAASVRGGGPCGQAGAIRLALAKSLCSFLDVDSIDKLRLAGLLTRDPRRKERKKPGQFRARKKYTWKKR